MSLAHRIADLSTLKAFQQDIDNANGDAEKLRALKNFHDAFVARSAAVRDALVAHEANQQQALKNAEDGARAAEADVAALEAELAALETTGAQAQTLKSCPGKTYRQFLCHRAELVAQLKVVQDVLSEVISGAAMKMNDPTDVNFAQGDNFSTKAQLLQSNLEALQAEAAQLNRQFVSVSDVDLTPAERQLEEVFHLAVTAASAVSAHSQKSESQKDGFQEFDSERKRLLLWCRQQKTNLDAISEPEHVQEFCASLLSNFPTMEENFNVLLEVAEPLLPSMEVQNALIETNEVWFHLQVSAFERLRQTILEIHPKSKLEDEVREFSTFTKRVRDFLEYFSQLLSAPSDAESQTYVRPVVEQCEALLLNFGPHDTLAAQLREFAQRMESARESYGSFRRAVLSRLTFLASSAPALATSMHRKEEYIARMKDLKKWIEVKSQGESWRDIHQRVLAIRELIEKEQAAFLHEKK